MSRCHCPGGVSGLSAAQAASQITSGTIGANSSQTTLAPIALTGTSILGALSYLWSVDIVLPQDASYVNTSAPVAPTAQSTTLNPQGPADYLLSCVGTGAFGSNTFKRLQTVTRPYPVVSSSLGPEEQAAPGPYAPTLSETNGADGPLTWATTATKVSDSSSVSVTGASTTTPSFTVVAGQAYRALHRVTDAYGRYNDLVVAISTAGIVPMFVTVTQPSNASVAGAATWTLTPTGGTGSFTYSVSALTRPATSSASITGGTTATPSVSLDKQGRYAFTSTVTDSTGLAVTVNCIVSLVWTPLVPGATPAVQSLSANTTTSGTITFITPTGGSGSYTNALTLTKPSGSVAALSASTGLVTTITGMANGEAYAVTCTSTDADAGSAATCNSGPALVRVATPTIAFSNPVPQSSATAGLATVNFVPATGGTGTLTYGTATLSVPVGSLATLSGSGTGPFTFTTDTPGAYGVTQSVTDTLGVSAQATGIVSYAPAGATWTTMETYDWTLVDSTSTSAAGSIALTVGGVAYKTLTTYTSGPVTSPVWQAVNGSGIRVSYSAGGGEVWFDFLASVPSSSTQKIMAQWIVGVPGYSSAGSIDVLGRITDAASWNGGAALSSLVYAVKPANYQMKTDFHSASTPSEATVRDSATDITWPACVTIIEDGYQIVLMVHQNCTDFVNPDSVGTGAVFTAYQYKDQRPSANYARWITTGGTIRVAMGHLDVAATSCYWRKTRVLQAPNL